MRNKIKTLCISILAILSLLPISKAKAAVVYPEYHPQDLIDVESLYNEVEALTIEGEEIQIVPQINFARFSQLKQIRLASTVVLNGDVFDLESSIDLLNISNSVIDMTAVDLNDFSSISVHSSYMVGEKVENQKIHNSNPLNEEYKLELDVYGLQNYESQIDSIARDIYNQSDGTQEDIIRLVTLYVIEHLEYDYDEAYVALPLYESIIDYEKGVCGHYSNFESRLLNKLGIFCSGYRWLF